MKTDNLTTMERRIVISAINRSDEEQHPGATDENLSYYVTEFAITCLENAVPHFKPLHARIARRAIMKLKCAAIITAS